MGGCNQLNKRHNFSQRDGHNQFDGFFDTQRPIYYGGETGWCGDFVAVCGEVEGNLCQ